MVLFIEDSPFSTPLTLTIICTESSGNAEANSEC